MALILDYKKVVGKMDYVDLNGNKFKLNFYKCNALLASAYLYKDEEGKKQSQLVFFACDNAHLKNMLGLTKGYKNILTKEIKKVYFDIDCEKDWGDAPALFARGQISVEFYQKKSKTKKEI